MTLSIAMAWLALSIPLGPGAGPATLEASIHLAVIVPNEALADWMPVGLATPFGYFTAQDHHWYPDPRMVHAEEAMHIRQMEALGPAYWLAYGLTFGEAFEPYQRGDRAALRHGVDLGSMWQPDARRFGQFKLTLGESPTLTFLPGYAEVVEAVRSAR